MECVYYVKEREMLSIPHEMSFIPNLLRNYFNHVKNNIEIHSGMDFKEYSFRRRRCVMKDMKKAVAAQLEDLSDVILTLTGCRHFWGEPELPDCMRVEMESESEN